METLQHIWDLKMPLEVTLSEEELLLYGLNCISDVSNRPFYTLMMRGSYHLLLLPQLRRHFAEVFTRASQDKTTPSITPWFEWNRRALEFHRPAGLLYDLLIDGCQATEIQSPVPWRIKLRLFDRPSNLNYSQFKDLDDESALKAHYYSLLKQSDYIRFGSCKKVMNLTKNEQMALWDGLWTQSFNKFWRAFSKVLAEDNSHWRNIPIKIYIIREKDTTILQGSVAQVKENTTIGSLLGDLINDNSKIVSQGIVLPRSTPVLWAAGNLVSPDGFLHCVLSTNHVQPIPSQ